MKNIRRLFCLLLTVLILFSYAPGALPAMASQEDGICEIHHAVHDEAVCGYVAAAGSPCGHTSCDADCLTREVRACIYPHTDCICEEAVQGQDCNGSCEYALKIAELVCDCTADEMGVLSHAEDCDFEIRMKEIQNIYTHNTSCGYVEGKNAVTCDHLCSVKTGCITMVCSHEHDENCGYVASVPGRACRFAGAACPQCEEEKKPSPVDNGTNQLFKAEVSFDTNPDKANKVYFKLYFGADSENMTNNTEITGEDNVSVKMEHGSHVTNFGYENGFWKMEFLRPNHPTDIVYTDENNQTYTVTLKYEVPESLRCMLFNDEKCIISDTWYVPEGNVYEDVKFFLGTDMYVDLSKPLTSGLRFENNDGAIEITQGTNGKYTIEGKKRDASAKVIYQADGKNYELKIRVQKPDVPCLRYWCQGMEAPYSGPWRISKGFTGDVKFYVGTNSETMMDTEDARHSVNVTVVSNNGVIQLTTKDSSSGWYTIHGLQDGTATVKCQKDEQEYTLDIIVEEARFQMMPAQPVDPPSFLNLVGLHVGNPVKLRCMLQDFNGGPPVTGALTGLTSSNTEIFTLALSSDPTEAAAGIYILTPVAPGRAEICYQENGKEYFVEVGVLDQSFRADGMVYYPAVHIMSGKTFPCTAVNIPVNGEVVQEFFYSQPAEAMLLAEGESALSPLTIGQVSWSGPITVEQPENDSKLYITGTAAGTGYLEVTSDDGVVHCFVVNVGRDRPNTEIQEGGYMWLNQNTVLGFGNPGIASNGDNNAEPGVLKLRSQVNSGFGSMDYPEDFLYREPVAFAAMDQTDGKPDADIMSKVENVKFSILACQNTDGTSGSYASVEKAQCEQIALTEGNVKAWTNYIVAGGTEAFKGLVGMSFELPDTKGGQSITRRISLYILLHNTYMGQEVRVEANVTTAAQLNVILSSYEALKTWIKQEHPEYADTVDYACNIDLKLPHGDLTDTIVVSEAIAPFPFRPNPSSNPNFRVYLMAPRQGDRTTMAGLISRGCLAGIFDVDFVADSDVTMKLGDEEFTCGLLADSTWSGTVEYDMDFAAQYGIDPMANKRNLSSWTQDGDMKHADCDIMSVEGCSFEGFDYGTRSTRNGYVGGGAGNSFKNCYFGIYIDCAGKPGWGDIHYTGFSGYDFKKNVAAVRIVGLQNNITPYEFRIHDCDFINNYLEFWINDYDTSYLQNYYFYRNHYRGGWKLNSGGNSSDESSGYGWLKYQGKAPNDEDLPDVHRGPKYQVQEGDTIVNNGVSVTISGTPGKAVPNLAVNSRASGEGYWIYDGKDQMTLIELGGDKLPLAQESLEALTKNADVTIVKNKGTDTAAIWTFEGGNGA